MDPNKENLIKIERHLSTDISSGNRSVRNVLERYKTARFGFALLACFGVSLIMSDGVLTPAQSVLGAIQGQCHYWKKFQNKANDGKV